MFPMWGIYVDFDIDFLVDTVQNNPVLDQKPLK